MGRKVAAEPVPVEIVQRGFALRDGQIVRRECRIAALDHEPATFFGPNGVAMVRMTYNGKIRRLSAARVVYAITKGHWPSGLLAKPRHKPSASGGRASSLVNRAEADMALIKAMSEAPHASIAALSALTGVRESRVSTRLTKLAKSDLTQSPMCVPGRSWCLTQAGKALAMNGQPLIDDLDRELLVAVALSPLSLMALKRRIEVCRLTVRRRSDRLIERGLVSQTDGRYAITDQGRAALGDQCPKPWVRPELVSAAAARDVLARGGSDLLTTVERGRMGGLAAAHGGRAMPSVELDRMAS
jgi:hypothetical protein